MKTTTPSLPKTHAVIGVLLAGLLSLISTSAQAMATHEVRAARHTPYAAVLPKARPTSPVLLARVETHPRAVHFATVRHSSFFHLRRAAAKVRR